MTTTKIVQLDPFKEITKPVIIDWEYALKAVATLDKYASDENRNPIKGNGQALNLLKSRPAVRQVYLKLME